MEMTQGDAGRFADRSDEVIGGCIEVHRHLGPGLLESAYERCLAHELSLCGMRVERQRSIPIAYKGVELDCGYRLDLLIEDRIVVEVKAVEALLPVHTAQALTYLKLTGFPVALLVNFNVPVLKQGLRRLTLSPDLPFPSSRLPVL